jgi:hypothetical protein
MKFVENDRMFFETIEHLTASFSFRSHICLEGVVLIKDIQSLLELSYE